MECLDKTRKTQRVLMKACLPFNWHSLEETESSWVNLANSADVPRERNTLQLTELG